MIADFLKSRLFLYGSLVIGTVLYWCFDSVWSFVSYERNLNALVSMVPRSFGDTFFLEVAPYQTASRVGFLLLLLFSGTLLIEQGKRKQKITKALLESETRYQYLLEHTNVGTCIAQAMVVKNPNLKLQEFLGYSEKELQGFPFVEIVHPDDRDLLLGWHATAMTGEVPITDMSFRIYTKEGDLRWLQLSTTPVVWQEKPAQFCVLHDVTRRKVRDEKHHQAKKMEAIGILAGGVVHDLNNILSGIASYPELLLQLLPDASPLCSHVETMHEAGLRASAVVADLLTVVRGMTSSRDIVDLNALIAKFMEAPECKVLKERYPGVRMSSRFHEDMVPILCSEIHIQKSLMNLLFNAFESIEEESGNVIVGTDVRNLAETDALPLNLEPGSYAVLSVADTGSGISAKHKEHIFEPFYTRKVMGRSGTGLGLTVVWNAAVDHDGAIDVRTSRKGTTFELYLPLTRLTQTTRKLLTAPDALPVRKGSGERVLIVDDEAQQREIGFQFLKFLNYSCVAVASGEEALEFLRREKVDLLLLDMVMDPGINGRETYEQILKIHPGQKALIISGFAGNSEIATALKLGAGGFVKKPYALRQLAEAVHAELHRD